VASQVSPSVAPYPSESPFSCPGWVGPGIGENRQIATRREETLLLGESWVLIYHRTGASNGPTEG